MKAQQITWFDMPNHAIVSSSSSSTGKSGIGVDENVMRALQDSFDAVTRLTLDVKKRGQMLMSKGSLSGTFSSLVSQGIQLCKDLVEPIAVIEDLLMQPMTTIDQAAAMTALKNAATPFEKLSVFKDELDALEKAHDKKKQLGNVN